MSSAAASVSSSAARGTNNNSGAALSASSSSSSRVAVRTYRILRRSLRGVALVPGALDWIITRKEVAALLPANAIIQLHSTKDSNDASPRHRTLADVSDIIKSSMRSFQRGVPDSQSPPSAAPAAPPPEQFCFSALKIVQQNLLLQAQPDKLWWKVWCVPDAASILRSAAAAASSPSRRRPLGAFSSSPSAASLFFGTTTTTTAAADVECGISSVSSRAASMQMPPRVGATPVPAGTGAIDDEVDDDGSVIAGMSVSMSDGGKRSTPAIQLESELQQSDLQGCLLVEDAMRHSRRVSMLQRKMDDRQQIQSQQEEQQQQQPKSFWPETEAEGKQLVREGIPPQAASALRRPGEFDQVFRRTQYNFDSAWQTTVFRLAFAAAGVYNKVVPTGAAAVSGAAADAAAAAAASSKASKKQAALAKKRLEMQRLHDISTGRAKPGDASASACPAARAEQAKRDCLAALPPAIARSFPRLIDAHTARTFSVFSPAQTLAAELYLRTHYALRFYGFVRVLTAQIAEHAPFNDAAPLRRMMDAAVDGGVDADMIALSGTSEAEVERCAGGAAPIAAPHSISSFAELHAALASSNAALLSLLGRQRDAADNRQLQIEQNERLLQQQQQHSTQHDARASNGGAAAEAAALSSATLQPATAVDAAQMVRIVTHVVECVLEYVNQSAATTAAAAAAAMSSSSSSSSQAARSSPAVAVIEEGSGIIAQRTRSGRELRETKGKMTAVSAAAGSDSAKSPQSETQRRRVAVAPATTVPTLLPVISFSGEEGAAASLPHLSPALPQLPVLRQPLSLHGVLFLICAVLSRIGVPWRTAKNVFATASGPSSAMGGAGGASRGYAYSNSSASNILSSYPAHLIKPTTTDPASAGPAGNAGFGSASAPAASAGSNWQSMTEQQLAEHMSREDAMLKAEPDLHLGGGSTTLDGNASPDAETVMAMTELLRDHEEQLQLQRHIEEAAALHVEPDPEADIALEAEESAPAHVIELILSGQQEITTSRGAGDVDAESAGAAAVTATTSKHLRVFPLRIELYRKSDHHHHSQRMQRLTASSVEDALAAAAEAAAAAPPPILGFIVAPHDLSMSVKRSLLLQYTLVGSFPTLRHQHEFMQRVVTAAAMSASNTGSTAAKDPVLQLTAHIAHVHLTKAEIRAFGGDSADLDSKDDDSSDGDDEMEAIHASFFADMGSPRLAIDQAQKESLRDATALWSNILSLF